MSTLKEPIIVSTRGATLHLARQVARIEATTCRLASPISIISESGG